MRHVHGGQPAFRRLVRRLRGQGGFALPLALGATFVLGITGTTVVAYATQNSGSASRSAADQQALALAEAGLNYAYSTLYNAQDARDGGSVPDTTVALENGFARYSGVLNGSTWTLTGVGRVPNPTGPGSADVVRTVSGRVTLGSARRSSANNAVWNYLYTDDASSCTEFSNSVVVDVPVYVRGDLCLSNTARMTGFSLWVGGDVRLSNSASVGTAAEPISQVQVAGSCQVSGQAPHSPCSAADRIYASSIGTTPGNLTKPPIDLAYWYENAMPGPRHACTTGSFPGGFDNDSVMNRSLPTVDLAPSFAYDCTVRDASGFEVGRIAWTPGSPGSLVVNGTIFFDGDIAFSQQTDLVYTGRGTIYSSGKITFANQTNFCGAPGCPNDWDPNQALVAFVAGSSTDRDGVVIGNYARVQAAMYAVTDFREGNNTIFWGPVIARQIHLINSVIHEYVPIDTLVPGMPATYEEVATLVNVPGSWG